MKTHTRDRCKHEPSTGKSHMLLSTGKSIQFETKGTAEEVKVIRRRVRCKESEQFQWNQMQKLTREFKAVSPMRKTALIVCILIINCHRRICIWFSFKVL